MSITLESFQRINTETSPGLARLVQKYRNPQNAVFTSAEERLMKNPSIKKRVQVEGYVDWVRNPAPDEMTFQDFERTVAETFRNMFVGKI